MGAKTILWVEDDDELVELLQPQIERQGEGWKVHRVASAAAGHARLAELKPDLVIMDVIMDGQHGFAAVEEIKRRPEMAEVPVVVFSSVSDRWSETTANRQDGLLSPADDFVDKADGPAQLFRSLRRLLSGR